MRLLRQNLPQSYIDSADKAIAALTAGMTEFQRAGVLFTYYSIEREVDTRALIDMAFEAGKRVALPVTEADGVMYFAAFRPEELLHKGRFKGIPEPGPTAERLTPEAKDVFIVPALCFDPMGYRLGYGGGYYDRYLAAHVCVTVGLCREKTVVDEVPRGPYDLPVQYLVTEKKITRPGQEPR